MLLTNLPKSVKMCYIFLIPLYLPLLELVIPLPYIINYVLSHFKKENSTVAERAWMLAWLCATQVSPLIYIVSGGFGRLHRRILWLGMTLLMVPAIGGFIMVGKSYLEDMGFKTCS